LGKDGKGYLLNRNNLGGIAAPVASANLPTAVRGQSAATYRTSQGTYFVFHTESDAVAAYKVTPTNPPTIVSAWTMSQTGLGSAFVTSTDGTNNGIVWVAGGGGDGRLHGYNGDTGAVVYAGGGANEMMTGTRKWNTGIVPTVAFIIRLITRSMPLICRQGHLPPLHPLQHLHQLHLRLRRRLQQRRTDGHAYSYCDRDPDPDSNAYT
jgi:hypothetical protein